MSLKGHISTELILRIAIKSQLLENLVLADHFQPRTNLPLVLEVSIQQVLVQNQLPLKGDKLVKQQRSTCVPSAINVKGTTSCQPVSESNQDSLSESFH